MFRINIGINAATLICFTVRMLIKPMVKKRAIGSLLPDSNSSKGFKGAFNPIRLDLKILNTAAASVDETIEPRSIPSRNENLRIYTAKYPIITAVTNTPTVDSKIPCQTIGLVSFQLVSNPPEKIIKIRATIPMDFAICALSKYIPPKPSDPTSIPIARNSNNTGMANLSESRFLHVRYLYVLLGPAAMGNAPVGCIPFILLSNSCEALPQFYMLQGGAEWRRDRDSNPGYLFLSTHAL
jgi:hypothetical protein